MPSYGTSFEELSDEERGAVKRKPRAVHEEIVTDERGKRRFHGAFTGGFSAGYFNTVGSKEGWAPTTFKSSRESRAESTRYQAVDFMDSEDLGEFGIASKRLRMKSNFADAPALLTESNQLAWERSSAVAIGPSSSRLDNSITTTLMDMLKPVTDSIGVQLMKKMGWREGKGVGPSMTRRELERQKVIDAKESGAAVAFDEAAVREVEEVAPDAEFCPTDAPDFQFTQKENVHGLGYQPLQESGILAQDYGKIAVGLKASRSGRAIRGQAFGVGAYEDDDEDIYTTYDLTQYDFEVGASSSTTANSTSRFDCSFVPATKATKGSRKFFEAPKPPPGFRPVVRLPPEDFAKNLSEKILKVGERLTPFERAKFLGERDNSVLELLSDADRQRLISVRATKAAAPTRVNPAEPFEEEPMKNHRFKQFVQYLRRGIDFPQPIMLTRLEWEKELEDFKQALTLELRALLPEVSARQQPLAKLEFSQPIAEQLKSRFQSEANVEETTSVEKSMKHHADHDRIQAIRMNMFGELTRLKYKWYPSKEVCKRFNVPPPYPDSSLIGVPELRKRRYAGYDAMDFTVVGKTGSAMTARPSEAVRGDFEFDDNFFSSTDGKNDNNLTIQSTEAIPPSTGDGTSDNAPFELLKVLFQESSSDSESDNDNDENSKKDVNIRPESPSSYDHEELKVIHEEKPVFVEKVVTVLDLVEDDDVYGPKPPPNLENVDGPSRPVVYDVVDKSIREDRSDGDENHRTNKHASKKSHKSGKHKKKEKKRKESKRDKKRKKHSKYKQKARSRDSSPSSSDSSVEIIV